MSVLALSRPVWVSVFIFCLGASVPGQFISDIRHPDRPRRLAPITVESHRVVVEIRDGVAKTTVRQVFRNPNGLALEGTYMFPLPDDAAVADFSLRMGEQMVRGEVLERDKAASIYEGIVRRQKDPALLEFVGRRLFQAKIFPIPARGTAEIALTYDETLHRDGSTLEMRYPFRTRSVSGAPVAEASVQVSIESTEPMLTVYSPSHEVEVVKKGDHRAQIGYEAKGDPGDRDFVVTYGLSAGAVGATMFSHEEDGNGAFLLLLAPSSEGARAETVAKDVVFVVDTSGSMVGAKLAQAKSALSYCINRLNDRDRFGVVTFATDVNPWSEGLLEANGANRERALGFVEKLEARGGTNINDALVHTLGMSERKDRPFMIIFMTDGEPTVQETVTKAILENVRKANQALTRLFVFGIGESLKVDLLDLLAEENHGARDYVGTKENIEAKVSSFFDKVAYPVLTDVRVQIEGIRTSELYPKTMPDLFRGSQVLLTGRYEGGGTALIKLRGRVNGREIEHVFERPITDGKDKTAFVPRLWAVRKVGYLMDQIRLHGAQDELEKEIVRLGKRYGIVTPYTSYLVLEDEALATRPADGQPGAPVRRGGGRGGSAPRGSAGAEATPGSAPVAGGAVAPSSPAPEVRARRLLESLTRSEQSPAADEASEGRAAERKKERDRLDQDFFSDSIRLSQEVRRLREREQAGGGVGEGLVRRVANRTFLVRPGFVVESSILDLEPEVLQKRLVRVEAYSDRYFELMRRPGMAAILALSESLIFADGESVIQVVPPGAPAAEKK